MPCTASWIFGKRLHVRWHAGHLRPHAAACTGQPLEAATRCPASGVHLHGQRTRIVWSQTVGQSHGCRDVAVFEGAWRQRLQQTEASSPALASGSGSGSSLSSSGANKTVIKTAETDEWRPMRCVGRDCHGMQICCGRCAGGMPILKMHVLEWHRGRFQ